MKKIPAEEILAIVGLALELVKLIEKWISPEKRRSR